MDTSYDDLDDYLAEPDAGPVMVLGGPPIPRLAKEFRKVEESEVVTDLGLDFFFDPTAGSVFCSECGGPCEKTDWLGRFFALLCGLIGVAVGCAIGLLFGCFYIAWDQSHREGGLGFWTAFGQTMKTILKLAGVG